MKKKILNSIIKSQTTNEHFKCSFFRSKVDSRSYKLLVIIQPCYQLTYFLLGKTRYDPVHNTCLREDNLHVICQWKYLRMTNYIRKNVNAHKICHMMIRLSNVLLFLRLELLISGLNSGSQTEIIKQLSPRSYIFFELQY